MRIKSWNVLLVVLIAASGMLAAAGNDLFFGEVKVYSRAGNTASGVPFSDSALTAAHRSLPFGTKIRVVNLVNNRQVDLTVNDRIRESGPFILTLTRGAAAKISLSAAGQTRVEMTVLGKKAPQTAPPPAGNTPDTNSPGKTGSVGSSDPGKTPSYGNPVPTGAYTLQVGAFRRREYADRFRARLAGLGHPASVSDRGDGYYRVIVGPYPSRSAAENAKSALAGEAPGAFIRKKG